MPTPTPSYKPVPTNLGLRLTTAGINDSARFSPDGNFLLFISRERTQHQHPQLYEYDFQTQKEKRLTYQDGQVQDPMWGPDQQSIYYGSTTDEIKEKPRLIYKTEFESPYSPTEIYRSDRVGSVIERLTKQEGFQGFLSLSGEKKPALVFSSLKSHRLVVDTMTLNGLSQRTIHQDPKLSYYYPLLKGNLLIAVEKNVQDSSSQIVFGKTNGKLAPLDLPMTDFRDLIWASADKEIILFSAQAKDRQFHAIYAFHLKNMCWMEVLKDVNSNLTDPDLYKDEKRLVFTADLDGLKQIYLQEINLAGINCSPLGH